MRCGCVSIALSDTVLGSQSGAMTQGSERGRVIGRFRLYTLVTSFDSLPDYRACSLLVINAINETDDHVLGIQNRSSIADSFSQFNLSAVLESFEQNKHNA